MNHCTPSWVSVVISNSALPQTTDVDHKCSLTISGCGAEFTAEYAETQDVHELFDSLVRLGKSWSRQGTALPSINSEYSNENKQFTPHVDAATLDFSLQELLAMVQNLV